MSQREKTLFQSCSLWWKISISILIRSTFSPSYTFLSWKVLIKITMNIPMRRTRECFTCTKPSWLPSLPRWPWCRALWQTGSLPTGSDRRRGCCNSWGSTWWLQLQHWALLCPHVVVLTVWGSLLQSNINISVIQNKYIHKSALAIFYCLSNSKLYDPLKISFKLIWIPFYLPKTVNLYPYWKRWKLSRYLPSLKRSTPCE